MKCPLSDRPRLATPSGTWSPEWRLIPIKADTDGFRQDLAASRKSAMPESVALFVVAVFATFSLFLSMVEGVPVRTQVPDSTKGD